jgi:hypothetical protein
MTMVRHTRTYAVLEVPPEAFALVRAALEKASGKERVSEDRDGRPLLDVMDLMLREAICDVHDAADENLAGPKCGSADCDADAMCRVSWPGREPLNMCSPCTDRARAVATALGFQLPTQHLDVPAPGTRVTVR